MRELGGYGMFFTKEYEYVSCINNVFNFFYLKKGILYKRSSDSIEELFNDVFKFSVYIDDLGIINIGIINFFGEIMYVRYEKDRCIKNKLDIYNIPIKDFENIRIYVHKNIANIIIIKKNTSKNSVFDMIHYFIINNEINKYKVVEFLGDDEHKFYETDVDMKGNIHIVYRSKSNLNHIFYKMFNSRYSKWSIPEKVNKNKEVIKEFSILCDTKGCIHIVLYRFEFDIIKVDYLVKNVRSTYTLEFEKRKSIKNILGGLSEAFLIQIDNDIKIIWNQNSKFYKFSIGEHCVDNIEFENNQKLIPIIYIGNVYKMFESIKMHMYYRYLEEDIKLLGIDEQTFTDSNICIYEDYEYESIDDLDEEAISIDGINSIKNSIIDYSNEITDYLNNKNRGKVFANNSQPIIYDYKEHYSYKIIKLKKDIENMKKREVKFLEMIDKIGEDYKNLEFKFNNLLKQHEDIKGKVEKTNLISKINNYIGLNKRKD